MFVAPLRRAERTASWAMEFMMIIDGFDDERRVGIWMSRLLRLLLLMKGEEEVLGWKGLENRKQTRIKISP